MLRATTVVRRGTGDPDAALDTLTLTHDQRHRRRIAMVTDGGVPFLLDLSKAAVLEDGDAVRLEDGGLIMIKAAPEQIVEIRADDALTLKKIIWHLGNRHAPAEIADEAVYIAHDHVLIEMACALGARTSLVERPFRPERGAYDHDRSHQAGSRTGPAAGHSAHGHG
jgi:urease accessory protein